MTQRVVVVGATGLIGRPLCDELMRTGLDAALHDLLDQSHDTLAAVR